MSSYEVVIGIEVHAQLNTQTKLFTFSRSGFSSDPNQNISSYCLAFPGALPVLNEKAVKKAISAGLSLNCTVHLRSVFERKNYFYPDLPKGYQISQFAHPICTEGWLDIVLDSKKKKRIGITRIHMEEDAGKLVHQGSDSIEGATHSYVDLNRSGCPLIEIVSEPDIRSAEEARAYVEALHFILVHRDICDGSLEHGNFRMDVNISLRKKDETTFGTRAEIKNLNSFRSVERAILAEVKRQTDLLDAGFVVIQETRNYDDASQTTTSLRSKEDSSDYRYFPDPDLPPLILTEVFIDSVRSEMPEDPYEKMRRYKALGLTDYDVSVLMSDRDMDVFFCDCLALGSAIDPKDFLKWVMGDLNAVLKEKKKVFSESFLRPRDLSKLLLLVKKGDISGKMLKDIVLLSIEKEQPLDDVLKTIGGQISDKSVLSDLIKMVLDANQDVVEKIKNGKKQSVNFLIGQVMKASKGKANPDLVKEMLCLKLEINL